MPDINLVLSLPNAVVTATSLGVSDFAWHRSPGTSRKFHGHSITVDLALQDGYPAFEFMNEGGWRDTKADTTLALDAVRTGQAHEDRPLQRRVQLHSVDRLRACLPDKNQRQPPGNAAGGTGHPIQRSHVRRETHAGPGRRASPACLAPKAVRPDFIW